MELSPQKLRQQYGEKGIYAGASHFKDYWSRDSLFASLGALAIKDYEQVEKTLNHFMFNLKDGHVPIRMGAKNEVLRYLGLPTAQGAVHTQDKGDNESIDGNLLFLIVAEKFNRVQKNKIPINFLKEIQGWIDKNIFNHLIVEGPYSSWEDSLKLEGARLYANVCYYRSLIASAYLFDDKYYLERAEITKKEIQKWWTGEFFADGPERNVCMSAGNLLAIIWGVASKTQAKKILSYLAKRKTVCPPSGMFKPTFKEVYVPFFFIGLPDYHARMEWSWLGALEINAYMKAGLKAEAKKRQKKFENLMNKFGEVYEVYYNDKPVRRIIYRSEKNFAWALGIYFASIKNRL